MKIAVGLLVMLLTACGSGNSALYNTSPKTSLSATAVLEARAMAEATGKIPKLDRSASILGADANANGVRDDIDAWIDSQSDTPPQKAAMKQFSASMDEEMTVDVTNFNAVQAAGDKSGMAMECIYDLYGFDVGSATWEEVRKYTINTKERFSAYMKADKAMSGHSFKSHPKDTACVP